MRNLRSTNKLRRNRFRGPSRRAAFSLAELVISIGILILMMSLAGQVFSITVRSTGQASALTEITQRIRVLEDTLREDLRGVQPGESLILIQGNPVNAYWTRAGLEADALIDGRPETGYPHIADPERERVDSKGEPVLDATKIPIPASPRADMLMIFSSRKSSSYVQPEVSGQLRQIVYGHTELGEYVSSGAGVGSYNFVPDPNNKSNPVSSVFPLDSSSYPSPTAPSRVPASEWHLGRRSVVLQPTAAPTTGSFAALAGPVNLFNSTGQGMGDARFLSGQMDVLWDFDFSRMVLRPGDKGPWHLPAVFYNQTGQIDPAVRGMLDATPPPTYASRMGQYFMPNCASFKVEWSLDPRSPFVAGRLDGVNETFWFDPGDMGDAGRPTFRGPDPLYSLQARIDELSGKTDAASAKLRRKLTDLLCAQTQHSDGRVYSLADRFRGVTCAGSGYDPNDQWEQLAPDGRRPNMIVFPATRPDGMSGESIADDIWPAALRITVDLLDREGRLERPIRHVMVIPVGG